MEYTYNVFDARVNDAGNIEVVVGVSDDIRKVAPSDIIGTVGRFLFGPAENKTQRRMTVVAVMTWPMATPRVAHADGKAVFLVNHAPPEKT